ncbi:hypothetical protein [Clostridium ljungdahlii]|uniref:Uncharacterized protein n=1 Tax=Clostridium ljungdahlii TaxID=1538 RepID=A0A162LA10_9CLOT|nr:hypothetical protein [Clostridium ljungdahlii]OAA90796.1 hypothetical protein WY13_01100 [Clostridium ljungdahlii]
MENIIMAICYKNEKDKKKVEKLIHKLIIYIQKSCDKSHVKLDFLSDISTIIITVKSLNSIDYYFELLHSGCLYNSNFNPHILSLIGTKKEILKFIKYKISDLKVTKKIMILKGDEYFAI